MGRKDESKNLIITSDEEVKEAVRPGFRSSFSQGTKRLAEQYKMCVKLQGDYAEFVYLLGFNGIRAKSGKTAPNMRPALAMGAHYQHNHLSPCG